MIHTTALRGCTALGWIVLARATLHYTTPHGRMQTYLDVLADVLLRLGGFQTHVAHDRLGVVPFWIDSVSVSRDEAAHGSNKQERAREDGHRGE